MTWYFPLISSGNELNCDLHFFYEIRVLLNILLAIPRNKILIYGRINIILRLTVLFVIDGEIKIYISQMKTYVLLKIKKVILIKKERFRLKNDIKEQ